MSEDDTRKGLFLATGRESHDLNDPNEFFSVLSAGARASAYRVSGSVKKSENTDGPSDRLSPQKELLKHTNLNGVIKRCGTGAYAY